MLYKYVGPQDLVGLVGAINIVTTSGLFAPRATPICLTPEISAASRCSTPEASTCLGRGPSF
jgi:hypothetical protein